MHNKRIIYELSVRNIIFISIERTPNLKRTFRDKIQKKCNLGKVALFASKREINVFRENFFELSGVTKNVPKH